MIQNAIFHLINVSVFSAEIQKIICQCINDFKYLMVFRGKNVLLNFLSNSVHIQSVKFKAPAENLQNVQKRQKVARIHVSIYYILLLFNWCT